jgi:hypothetical protein
LELELNEEEAAVMGEALECLISHPATDDDTRAIAIDLSHFLLALAAGHFDDWGDAEQEFVQQGVEAREQATSRAATRREQRLAFGEFEVVEEPLSNDPINW